MERIVYNGVKKALQKKHHHPNTLSMALPTNNRWKNFKPSTMRSRAEPMYHGGRYKGPSRRVDRTSRRVNRKITRKEVVPNMNNETIFPSLGGKVTHCPASLQDYATKAEKGAECPDPPAHVHQYAERLPTASKEEEEPIDYDDPNYTEYMDRVYLSEEDFPPSPPLSPSPLSYQIQKPRGFEPPMAPPLIQTMSKKQDKSFKLVYNGLDRRI